jgi:peptidoglycan/LPS O-acetylase OafA/YrhL
MSLETPPLTQRGAPREPLPALTTLRFVAAAMIVVYHTYLPFGIGRRLAETVMLQQGVCFFFVLSGFILAHVYPRLDASEVRPFLVARFARLWPLHLVTFLAVLVLLPSARDTAGTNPWLVAIANLALVQAWSARREINFSFNGPSWSISTEVAFYAVFPLLIRDFARTWPWKLAAALVCAAAIVAYTNQRATAEIYVLVYMHPLARVFEFVLGMTLALVWRRLRPHVTAGVALGTLLELGSLVLAGWVMIHCLAWARAARPLVGEGGALWLVNAGFPCLVFGVLIVAMALGRGLVSRALATPPLVVLGEVSYAVYLVHHILVRLYELHRAALAGIPAPIAYGCFWALVLVLACFSWTYVERPARRWLLARSVRWRPSPATEPG